MRTPSYFTPLFLYIKNPMALTTYPINQALESKIKKEPER
jgi:hypothetical protein